MNVPTSIPATLVAGDSWQWLLSLSDYPAPTWLASVFFRSRKEFFKADAVASGTDQSFSIAASTTAGYTAGRYEWSVRVTDGTNVVSLSSGWTDVSPNPAASGERDPRSWARRTLDALEATLEGRASADQMAMTINGRSISRMSIPDLRAWRAELRQEVTTQEKASVPGKGRDIRVRFGRV